MDCREISVWLEREKLHALEKALAQEGHSTTGLLQERLIQLYEETVPLAEQQQITAQMEEQERQEELNRLAARRFAAVRVTEDSVARCFELEGYNTLLNLANACSSAYQQKKDGAEHPVRLPFYQMAFQKAIEISADAYQEHCRQAGSSPNVTLTADIDCDTKTLVVETEIGALRYSMDTVVKAVMAAYRKQGLRAEQYQARLMEQLEKLCPSRSNQEAVATEGCGQELRL